MTTLIQRLDPLDRPLTREEVAMFISGAATATAGAVIAITLQVIA